MAEKVCLREGQLVNVDWPNGDALRGAILHNIPQATGEAWVFEDGKGILYHITEGITVWAKKEG